MSNSNYTIMISTQCLLLFCFLIPVMAIAQKTAPEGKKAKLSIMHSEDFDITGDMESPAWKAAPWIQLPQREKGEVKYETKAKLLYSNKGIYTLFWCEDNQITATLKEDMADIYNEDVVEIFFWTDERFPLYFEYELSPLNYELAILVPNMRGTFFGWTPWHYEGDRKAKHATKIVKEGEKTIGWVAEFFIPYTLLTPLTNVPPIRGTKWRMNMYRIDYDKGVASWSWQPTRVNFHDIESFGTLVFE
jgi:Carbohydrate family 9 binding domain-like